MNLSAIQNYSVVNRMTDEIKMTWKDMAVN
jgi:hypothetical protein